MTVGQDLLKLELGGAPKGGEKEQAGQEPKAPASDEQPTSSDPQPGEDEAKQKKEPRQSDPPTEKRPTPPKEDSKPNPPPKESSPKNTDVPKPQESKKSEPKPTDMAPSGNREERRVNVFYCELTLLAKAPLGQNESHASTNLRTPKTISEHCGFPDNI